MAALKGSHFVVSAGLTATGAPAYRRPDGSWTQDLQSAHAIESAEERDAALASAEREEREVCDPYAFPVRFDGGRIDPLSARERIRAEGPTVPFRRPDA